MKKYGLQLRVPPSQQTKKPVRPPVPTPIGFRDEDDDDDVEREILRQASKNKSLKDVEEQHKKALEEDPSVFDYDGVYDEMKEKLAKPRAIEREERKPKYIQALMKKVEIRKREQEIIYEKKLAKERSKDDHLYQDKDKFVTSAYKKKLAENSQWLEEQRLRELQEEKDDVTKKKDLTDFYFNLGKNVAFGAKELESSNQDKQTRQDKHTIEHKQKEHVKPEKADGTSPAGTSEQVLPLANSDSVQESHGFKEMHQIEVSPLGRSAELSDRKPVTDRSVSDHKPVSDSSIQEKAKVVEQQSEQLKRDHHKRDEDALASAKERYLARKRAKIM